MKIQTLKELFELHLSVLLSAENQLVEAIPVMVKNATDIDLKEALSHHLQLTKIQVKRLGQIAKNIDFDIQEKEDKGLANLLKQEQQTLEMIEDKHIKDTAIMAGTAKVEHYEMAFYQAAKTIANELGLDDAVDLLDASLDEEKEAATAIESLASGGFIGKVVDVLS